jgi:hypothetical protein
VRWVETVEPTAAPASSELGHGGVACKKNRARKRESRAGGSARTR